MNEDLLCKICNIIFDKVDRLPYTFSDCCGDTVCKLCCQKSVNDQKIIINCPMCETEVNKNFVTIKPNKMITKLLQDSQKLIIYCEEHNQEITLYSNEQLKCKKCDCENQNSQTIQSSDNLFNDVLNIEKYYNQLLNIANTELQQIQNQKQKSNIPAEVITQILQSYIQTKSLNAQIDSIVIGNNQQDKNETVEELKSQNQKLKQQLKQYGNKIGSQKCITEQSILLTQSNQQIIQQWLKIDKLKTNLLFRASKDGFNSKAFHNFCDGIENTLVLLRSDQNEVFGGYANRAWDQTGSWIVGQEKSFLFSITQNIKLQCNNGAYEMKGHQQGLCIFGDDLVVFPNANKNQKSYSNLGFAYELPEGIEYASLEASNFLTGNYNFKIEEMEVLQIDY